MSHQQLARRLSVLVLPLALLAVFAVPSGAEPILQLYAEGATYNPVTESWEKSYTPGETLRLWTIAWTTSKGSIFDVKLSIAYESQAAAPSFTLTPSTTGGYGGFTDPSTPGTATFVQNRDDGSSPELGDGTALKDLPGHGIFGPGVAWTEFLLGDFTLDDSSIADFTTGPWASGIPERGDKMGQINVYEITVAGLLGDSLHFDLYDHYVSGTKIHYKFAPFSHDADFTVPEAGAITLFASGLVGLVFWRRKKRLE